MDIASLCSTEPAEAGRGRTGGEQGRPSHSYPTRHGNSFQGALSYSQNSSTQPRPTLLHGNMGLLPAPVPLYSRSPEKTTSKTVHFHLLLSNDTQQRLPLRVSIKSHDTTHSINSTVKSFWGLYDGQGVSFEDQQGNTLIAQYENLEHNCHVFVRPHTERQDPPTTLAHHAYGPSAPPRLPLGEPFQMMPPQQLSRPGSRATKRRDTSSPAGRIERSASSRGHPTFRGIDEDNSDSDNGSVSSSRRARSELASAEISLDNIVEGGRRKRAKFESSELPLFAPPQLPMVNSISSMSPQRRFQNGNAQSPITYNNPANFSYNHQPAIFSPNSYNYNHGLISPHTGSIASGKFSAPGYPSSNLRESGQRMFSRLSGGSNSGLLPTPDPTVGSVISDEDVALQLMRLGDASNISRGRTSTSTLDETLSGKAEAASSGGASDIGSIGAEERPLPSMMGSKPKQVFTASHPKKKLKGTNGVAQLYSSDATSGEEYDDHRDGTFKGESDEVGPSAFLSGQSKVKAFKQKSRTSSTSSKGRPTQTKTKSKSGSSKITPSPYAATPDLRKDSDTIPSGLQQFGADEDDLSSKPRCQRCRKSKKGCDRQRPCQRCKDAGIGAEGCISEDEGNGRKGRFGRHMGVPVKKDSTDSVSTYNDSALENTDGYAVEAGHEVLESSKKRKR